MTNKFSIFKGISAKFLVPTLLVIILAMSIMGYFSYQNHKAEITEQIDEQAEQKITEIKSTIDERQENANITEDAINDYLISVTKILSEHISMMDEENFNREINNLVDNLNISEIHITDSEGVIQWSTVPDFIGFDFDSSEQTKPFLDGLDNKNFTLAQETQRRGTTNELFKYVGVARIEKKGIVQIGVQPENLQKIFDKIDVASLADSMQYGNDGYVFVTNLDGEIVSHPDSSLEGTKIQEYSFGKEIVNQKDGKITYKYEGEERINHFSKYNNYIISTSLPTSEYKNDLVAYRNKLLMITFITIIIISLIIIYITKKITDPINKSVEITNRIANNDLTAKMPDKYLERKDEIGILSQSINRMSNNIRQMVRNISSIAENLSASSEELSASSEEISASAEQVGRAIEEVASGAEEQSAQIDETRNNVSDLASGIDNVSDMSEDMDKQADNVISNIDQGKNEINNTIEQVQEVKVQANKTSENINELGDLSEEIGEIVELINGISTQTNLLALNAAIEAARAGEAGRGFSVVADEIRELAEESSEATENIAGLITDIQNRVEVTIGQMNKAEDAVGTSVDAIKSTEDSFEEINNAARKLRDLIEDVSKATNEMAENSSEVSASIEEIAAVSEEASGNAEEVAASSEEQIAATEDIVEGAEELAKISDKLIETIEQFKLK